MNYQKPTFLLVFLLLANTLQATVIREDFARLVDYAGWQLVDAYMQDYVRLRPDMTAEKEGYRLFRETYNEKNFSVTNPPPSEAVRLFLVSHDWRGMAINLYNPFVQTKETYQNEWTGEQATQTLQERIAAVSPEALGAQSDADYTTLQATKKQLADEVAASFLEPTEASTLASDTTSGENGSDAEVANQRGFTLPMVSAEDEGGTSGVFSYAINPISLGAVAVLLLLALYLLGLVKRLDTRVDNHSKRIEDLTSRLFLKKDPMSAEEAKQLKSRIAKLEEQVQQLAATSSPPSGNPSPTRTLPKQEEYYLSTPNQDGTFNASSMSEQFRPSASIYRFLVTQKNGNHWAEFTVSDDFEAVKDALSSPTSYLDPVCESTNAFFPGAKRIVNVRPGRALRQGDKWVVKSDQKARIRYE